MCKEIKELYLLGAICVSARFPGCVQLFVPGSRAEAVRKTGRMVNVLGLEE